MFNTDALSKIPGLKKPFDNLSDEVAALALSKYRNVVLRGLQQALDGISEALSAQPVSGGAGVPHPTQEVKPAPLVEEGAALAVANEDAPDENKPAKPAKPRKPAKPKAE